MKSKDISLIVVVGIVSAVVALLLSGFLFTSGSNRQQKVEIVEPISADFQVPDKRYFNENSFNPTQNITIGNGDNETPFSQTQE